MKPVIFKICIIFCSLFFWAATGFALPFSVGDSTDLYGYKKPHQDNETNVNALIDFYNTDKDPDLPAPLTLLGKWEVDSGWTDTEWDTDDDPWFTVTFMDDDTDEYKKDTWSADEWDPNAPLYYSLKAGDYFSLFYTNGDTSGDWEVDWTNNGGQIPGLSHISFWTADGTVSQNPVPEPGTMALLGFGLIAAAGIIRNRFMT